MPTIFILRWATTTDDLHHEMDTVYNKWFNDLDRYTVNDFIELGIKHNNHDDRTLSYFIMIIIYKW